MVKCLDFDWMGCKLSEKQYIDADKLKPKLRLWSGDTTTLRSPHFEEAGKACYWLEVCLPNMKYYAPSPLGGTYGSITNLLLALEDCYSQALLANIVYEPEGFYDSPDEIKVFNSLQLLFEYLEQSRHWRREVLS